MESQKYVTDAGLEPSLVDGLPYRITTNDARTWLQKRLNVAADALRRDGQGDYKWPIEMYTYTASEDFMPLVLAIPNSAVDSNRRSSSDDEEFFLHGNNKRRHVQISDVFFKQIKPFIYNSGDIESFRNSTNYRYKMKMSREQSNRLAALALPRSIVVDREHRISRVIILLDPVRVFHRMLKCTGETIEYWANIDGLKKINNGVYDYTVYKIEKSANNKKSKDKDLMAALRETVNNGGKKR